MLISYPQVRKNKNGRQIARQIWGGGKMDSDFLFKLAREVTGMGPRTTGNRILGHSPDGELHGLEICYPYL